MNRLGISALEVEAFARALGECPHLELEGTFTHFASAEDFIGGQTVTQEEMFRSCLDRLRALGASRGLCTLRIAGRFARGRKRGRTWCGRARFSTVIISASIRRKGGVR